MYFGPLSAESLRLDDLRDPFVGAESGVPAESLIEKAKPQVTSLTYAVGLTLKPVRTVRPRTCLIHQEARSALHHGNAERESLID